MEGMKESFLGTTFGSSHKSEWIEISIPLLIIVFISIIISIIHSMDHITLTMSMTVHVPMPMGIWILVETRAARSGFWYIPVQTCHESLLY